MDGYKSGGEPLGAARGGALPEALPISVVVPAYNREHVIRETLDSVLAQTRLPRQVVVVDDGSADDTVVAARAWAEEARRRELDVRILSQANAGAAAARNAGLRAAAQPWIAFLDSDDLWAPEKLELQWSVVQEDPSVTCVFTDMIQFRQSGEVVSESFLSRYVNYQCLQRQPIFPAAYRLRRENLGREFLRANFINPSTLLVRRDVIGQVGMMLEGMAPCEDREFLLRLLKAAETAVVERPLVRYRMHAQNISGDALAMVLCTVQLADMIERWPERYIPGAADAFRSRRPDLLREAGIRALREARFDGARAYFWRSCRERWSFASLAGFLLACGGPAPYAILVRLKRLRSSVT